MRVGTLDFIPVSARIDLIATPVAAALSHIQSDDAYVAAIDASLADTAEFCDHYQVGLNISANCVVLRASRTDKEWYAACLVLATDRVDVNGVVRRHLDARKISFAPMDQAVSLSSMEYGGITPIGLPADWPILVDEAVIAARNVIIGSGTRGSKLYVSSRLLRSLPNATVLGLTKEPSPEQ